MIVVLVASSKVGDKGAGMRMVNQAAVFIQLNHTGQVELKGSVTNEKHS
jgi:cytochrome c